MIKNTDLMNVMDEEIKLYDIHPSDFILIFSANRT
jgi:hypothetical protein